LAGSHQTRAKEKSGYSTVFCIGKKETYVYVITRASEKRKRGEPTDEHAENEVKLSREGHRCPWQAIKKKRKVGSQNISQGTKKRKLALGGGREGKSFPIIRLRASFAKRGQVSLTRATKPLFGKR